MVGWCSMGTFNDPCRKTMQSVEVTKCASWAGYWLLLFVASPGLNLPGLGLRPSRTLNPQTVSVRLRPYYYNYWLDFGSTAWLIGSLCDATISVAFVGFSSLVSISSILSLMIPAGQIAMVPVMVASSVMQPLRDGDRQERMDPETESWLDHQLKSIQQLDFHDFFGFSIFHRPLDFIYWLSIFLFPLLIFSS